MNEKKVHCTCQVRTLFFSHLRFFVVSIACWLTGGVAYSQVVTDGSLGPAVTLSGQSIEIVESLGTRAGNNLFHSFNSFSIGQGESATFTGAGDIQNVISRVTGGDTSTIQGTLRSSIGVANFFFVNPAGITFSESASVDVPASFHLSTADELYFQDGAVLDVRNNANSTLSMATPEAFGFLDGATGFIQLTGAGIDLANTAAELTLSAGNITVSNSTLVSGPGGVLELEAANQLTLTDVSQLSTNGGAIQIAAGSLLIDGEGSRIDAGRSGTTNSVTVTVADDVVIQDGGQISSEAFGEVSAGSLQLIAQQLLIDGQDNDATTGIVSRTTTGSTGSAGRVEVFILDEVAIQSGGEISSNSFGPGDAGNVNITAGQLLIDGSGVSSDITSDSRGIGNSGNVDVSIAETATILNGGEISSNAFGQGNAGNVKFSSGQLLIDQQGASLFTGIFSEAVFGSTGEAGSVEVNVTGAATILGGGQIGSDTYGEGNAGSVEVTISGLATIADDGLVSSNSFDEEDGLANLGNAGNVRFTAGQLLIDQAGGEFDAGISSDAQGSGDAGSVEVTITEVATIQNGGRVSSNSLGQVNAGDAGNVQFTAGELLIDGARISSDTEGDGKAGQVEVTIAGRATIQNGSLISSDAQAEGDGGGVRVSVAGLAIIQNGSEVSSNSFGSGNAGVVDFAAGHLSIDRQESEFITGIASDTGPQSTGNAGSVVVKVDGTIRMIDSQIASRAALEESAGAAGSVQVSADQLVVVGQGDQSGIFTDSNEDQAGPVSVNTNSFILRNSLVSTSTGSDSLDGGDISIISEVLVLDSALIQANANSGSGGQIDIDSAFIGSGNQVTIGGTDRAEFQFDGPNVIQAVAPSGVSVPPSINAPELDVSGSLSELTTAFDDAPGLAFDPCAAFIEGAPSTLSLAGRGGMPAAAGSIVSFGLYGKQIDLTHKDIGVNSAAEEPPGLITTFDYNGFDHTGYERLSVCKQSS